jgi:hypothetical protein
VERHLAPAPGRRANQLFILQSGGSITAAHFCPHRCLCCFHCCTTARSIDLLRLQVSRLSPLCRMKGIKLTFVPPLIQVSLMHLILKKRKGSAAMQSAAFSRPVRVTCVGDLLSNVRFKSHGPSFKLPSQQQDRISDQMT